MHPGMMHWWKTRQRATESGMFADCGPTDHHHDHHGGHHRRHEWVRHMSRHDHDDFGSGSFGVRRPLRFLGVKLGLDDEQIAHLARILNDVKTERAQAEVDARRTMTAFADAVAGGEFDAQRAADGAALRVRSAEQLRDVVVKALGEIHALLRPEQRERLAYLIRTGTLVL